MIKLETIHEGTTFYGAELAFFEDEVTPISLDGAEVAMHLKRKGDDEILQVYSTGNSKLTLDGNKIVIPEHIPSLVFGKYEFDFNMKFNDSYVETGVARGEWEILKPVTRL